MKMELVDVSGVVYSSGGLRFGGFQTRQFLELTEDLEKLKPGVRNKVIAEAHYLAVWLLRFPEIAFFFGTLFLQSLFIGFLCFVGAFIFEIIRFYTFGASPLISYLCRFWGWIKWPLFIGVSILLWPAGKLIPIAFIAFLVVQGWAGLISTIIMLPVKMTILNLLYKVTGKKRPHIYNIEGHAMQYVIDHWRMKLLPPKEALKFYQLSKKDIEFYNLSSDESFKKAYKDRVLLNSFVTALWLLTAINIIKALYFLIIGNFGIMVITFLKAVLLSILWYVIHDWALKHPKKR